MKQRVIAISISKCIVVAYLLSGCNPKESAKTKPTNEDVLENLNKPEEQADKTPTKMSTVIRNQEVEISPAKWVNVIREITDEAEKADWRTHSQPRPRGGDDGYDRMKFRWNGQDIVWEGAPIPISLREWENKLFVIGFDRTVIDKFRFRYFRQDGASFKEIASSEFPKRIATQNMAFGDGSKENLEITRTLNVTHPMFSSTRTANIWHHLGRGKEYFESKSEDDINALKDYKKQFNPIPLPTIKREKPSAQPDEKTSEATSTSPTTEKDKK